MRRIFSIPKRMVLGVLRRWDPVRYARAIGVVVGHDCKLLSTNFGSEPFLVRLGNRVEITHGVQFITHDGAVWVLRDKHPDLDVIAPIVVDDHAFIGMNSILLPGVHVGQRSIVAAGSVVTRDVAPETVVAGAPARLVCSLEDYRVRSLKRSLDIKQLRPREKREFLLARFPRPTKE